MKLLSASPYNKDKKINLGGLGSFKLKVTKSHNKKEFSFGAGFSAPVSLFIIIITSWVLKIIYPIEQAEKVLVTDTFYSF